MYAKHFIKTHRFPLVAGGFPSTFPTLKLALPASTLTGEEKAGNPAARINNSKERLRGEVET